MLCPVIQSLGLLDSCPRLLTFLAIGNFKATASATANLLALNNLGDATALATRNVVGQRRHNTLCRQLPAPVPSAATGVSRPDPQVAQLSSLMQRTSVTTCDWIERTDTSRETTPVLLSQSDKGSEMTSWTHC